MEELKEFYKVIIDDTPYESKLTPKFLRRKKYVPADPKKITAFIPGAIRVLNVRKGQHVNSGDDLFILEAMKMNNSVKSSQEGIIKEIHIKVGSIVAKGELLIEFE